VFLLGVQAERRLKRHAPPGVARRALPNLPGRAYNPGMNSYQTEAPTRDEVDATPGAVLLNFGTDWCGYCQAAAPRIDEALASHSAVRHLKVEDGPGRPLGRSFRVKLWPTLILLKDGVEVARVVRPESTATIAAALASLA
jgi:thioredoxin 1